MCGETHERPAVTQDFTYTPDRDALDLRGSLPEALRILLQDYPRDLWEAHPCFNELIRFWLQRNLLFRQLLDGYEQESQIGMDQGRDMMRQAAVISRYAGMLVGELHKHHNVDDANYFPVLAKKDARLETGFNLLDVDHLAMDGLLNRFTDASNTAITQLSRCKNQVDASAAYLIAVGDLKTLLDRHLTDEEELVVPILLHHGTGGFH